MLLERGANVNLKARKGSAPLHMAVWNGDHVGVVRRLLAADAEAGCKNHDGKTPLELACWFDALDAASAAPQLLNMEAWREAWGKPAAGRKGVIALLEAATGAAGGDTAGGVGGASAGGAAAVATSAEGEGSGPRGRRGRTRSDEDEDEDAAEESGGEGAGTAMETESAAD